MSAPKRPKRSEIVISSDSEDDSFDNVVVQKPVSSLPNNNRSHSDQLSGYSSDVPLIIDDDTTTTTTTTTTPTKSTPEDIALQLARIVGVSLPKELLLDIVNICRLDVNASALFVKLYLSITLLNIIQIVL
jgi:hypothetical protein